jgi:hypothetical protein
MMLLVLNFVIHNTIINLEPDDEEKSIKQIMEIFIEVNCLDIGLATQRTSSERW